MPNTDDTTEVLQTLAESLGEDARDKLTVAVERAFQPLRHLVGESFILNERSNLAAVPKDASHANNGAVLTIESALNRLQATIMEAAMPVWRDKHVRGFVDEVRHHARYRESVKAEREAGARP